MRWNIEAVLILQITIPIQPSFYQPVHSACSEFHKYLEVCLEDVTPVFHKLLLYLAFCCMVVGNENTAKCVLQVLVWQLQQLSHLCCHSYVRQTIQWHSFFQAGVTFAVAPHQERRRPRGVKVVICSAFTAYYWTGRGGKEADIAQFYKYLGLHINNRLDRTNKRYCSRGDTMPFFQTITSTCGSQYTLLCSGVQGRKQHSEGCRQDLYQTSGKKRRFYYLTWFPSRLQERPRQKTKPNSILNNISQPFYGDIQHLLHDPKVQHEGLFVLICSTHSISKWPFSLLANWEVV